MSPPTPRIAGVSTMIAVLLLMAPAGVRAGMRIERIGQEEGPMPDVATALCLDPWGSPSAFLWTPWTGFLDVTSFLNSQGTYAQDWILGAAGRLAGDGRTMGGWAATPFGFQGWFVRMPKVVLCHSNPAKREERKTLLVDFPTGLPDHMAHGDTIGICGNGVF